MRRHSVLVSLFFASLLQASGAPFANGSFEFPPIQQSSISNYYVFLPAGDNGLSSWTIGGTNKAPGVLGSGITRVNGTIQELVFPPADGRYHLVFNDGNRPSGDWISQTFDTVPGETYVVSFQVGRRSNGLGSLSMTVTAAAPNGSTLGAITAKPPAQGYGPKETFLFTAASESTTIKFQDTSSATVSVDLTLDNVTVGGVEEPTLNIAVKTVEVSMFVTVGVTYQLESSSDLATWTPVGPLFRAEQTPVIQEFDVSETGRYFRLHSVP